MVLSRTMHDDQNSFILACDGCGGRYPAAHVVGDAVDLWLAAYRQGWRLARGPGIEFAHLCPACGTPVDEPA